MGIRTSLVTNQPEIGKLICELRLSTGLTQEKFAAELGFSYPTISRWENGRAQPSALAIHKIETHLRQMGDRGKDLRQRYLANR